MLTVKMLYGKLLGTEDRIILILLIKARRMKTTTETQRTQRITELKKGGKYKIFFLLVLSVFSVPLW